MTKITDDKAHRQLPPERTERICNARLTELCIEFYDSGTDEIALSGYNDTDGFEIESALRELLRLRLDYDALRASHKQLVLQAEALQGYYETDFFQITSVDGRTLADWYVKFCKAIDAAKQLSQ